MEAKKLTFVEKANQEQILFGKKLGLDLTGCSIGVAFAKIEDVIDLEFYKIELKTLTEKQINFGRNLGFDISKMSKRQGEAFLDDILYQMNCEVIKNEQFKPGVEVKNIFDKYNDIEIISSISKDGTVYFKGGNGKRAWARNLRKVVLF
jgi:RNase H-fold protein (predicted Holliday junction resolvase)